MAGVDSTDDSLYPIAVLIDELRNEDVQVDVQLKLQYHIFLQYECLNSRQKLKSRELIFASF